MNVIMTGNSRVSVPRRKNNRYKTTVYVKFCTLAENYRYAKHNNVDFTFFANTMYNSKSNIEAAKNRTITVSSCD